MLEKKQWGAGDLHHFTMPTTQNCLQTNSMSSVKLTLLFCRALFMGVLEKLMIRATKLFLMARP